MKTKKFCLTENQMPTQWYNIVADMPNKPLPPLHPGPLGSYYVKELATDEHYQLSGEKYPVVFEYAGQAVSYTHLENMR